MRYVGSPAGVKSPAETEQRARTRIEESRGGDHEPLGFWRVEARDDSVFLGVAALLRMPDGGGRGGRLSSRPRRLGPGLRHRGGGGAHRARSAYPRAAAAGRGDLPENRASQRVLDKLGFERRGLTEYRGVRATFHVLTRGGGDGELTLLMAARHN